MAIEDLLMLQFDIRDIPEGKSSKNVHLPEKYFDLDDDCELSEAKVSIEFFRADHFIKVSFNVNADLLLTCDRCLEEFEFDTSGNFDVLFEPGDVEEFESEGSAVRRIDSESLQLNIEKEVRDTILLKVPGRKIHPKFINEDGSVSEFKTRKFGDFNDEENKIDPRWEELNKLK